VQQFKLNDSNSRPGLIVSITPLDEKDYLIANYGMIYLFDSRSGEVDVMSADSSRNKKSAFFYNPTGLYYSPARHLLYVANYLGNNILSFTVDIKKRHLELNEIIASPHTISPENVFVSPDGKYLVCACYDGSAATAFDISVTPARELWSTPILLAHGICLLGDKVYVTGLKKKALYELSLQSGKILRKSGEIGWDPDIPCFLWPTSVVPFSDGELVLSDAHTGFIYIIGTGDLKVKKYFGGNGPTFKYLNMPYCVLIHQEKIIILSTFQERLIMGNKESFKIDRVVASDRSDWRYLRESSNLKIPQPGTGWDKYVWSKGPLVTLFGRDYMPGYGHLHPTHTREMRPTIALSSNGPLYSPESESYFLNMVPLEGGFLLFSPQRSPVYYIYRDSLTYLIPAQLKEETWAIGRALYNRHERIDLTSFSTGIKEKIQELERRRTPAGLLHANDFQSILFPSMTGTDFTTKFKETFKSAAGKEFYGDYQVYDNRGCSREDVIKLARTYFTRQDKEEDVNLDELLLVHMLTGCMP
jgi:hypothetical protein